MTVTLEHPSTAPSTAPSSAEPTVVDLQALRPLHALDLAPLTLGLDAVRRGHELTRNVRTRRWILTQVARHGSEHRAYAVLEQGRAVGVALVTNIRRSPSFTAELFLHVHRDWEHDRRAAAALTAAVDLARELGLHRLEAASLPEDPVAARMWAAGGFRPVGLARGYRLVDGRWADHVLHERLVTDPAPR